MRTFQSTITPVQVRVEWNNIKYLVDATTGAPVGIQNPNANGADGMWTPIEVSAEQARRPDAYLKADINSTYRLNVPPYTRYISTGSSIVEIATAPVGGGGGGTPVPGLPLSGGTLTGPLYLDADPVGDQPLRAATKHYVDHVDNLKLNSFGGTMTGPLVLAGNPAQPLEAATKQYVDAPRKGVTNGSEAASGEIGEYKVASNATGLTLPTTVPKSICSLALTAGDWEIWGTVDFRPAAGVSPNGITAAISTTTDALPTDNDLMTGVGVLNMFTMPSFTSGQRQVLMTGTCRANSAVSITVYLVGQATLGGSGVLTGRGYICARRVR